MPLSVSVIVPLHRETPQFRRCVEEVLALPDEDVELLVVSDGPLQRLPAGVRTVLTGSDTDTSPAVKRDAALEVVGSDICAFLDDDAYPRPDWIARMRRRLGQPGVDAVGGPGITPPGSSWRERAGGAFYESRLGSGSLRRRFVAEGPARDTDDWPAYNFAVRTSALRDIGGWGTTFYGGEDTAVCLALVEAGHRIVYDPDVVVYHFRRPIFGGLMRQVGNVGRHRGFFVRAYPRTSARLIYFAPSVALLAGLGLVAWAAPDVRRRRAMAALGGAMGAAIAAHGLREGHEPTVAAALPAVLAAGHAAYGWGFLRGLATTSMES